MVTLPVPKAVESVAPEMSPDGVPDVTVPAAAEPMVKSFGSISQVPDKPMEAAVVTRAVSAM